MRFNCACVSSTIEDRPEIVAPLSEIQREGGLAKELRGNVDPLICSDGARPGHPHVARDLLLLIAQTLIGFEGAFVGGFAPG